MDDQIDLKDQEFAVQFSEKVSLALVNTFSLHRLLSMIERPEKEKEELVL